jgi:hypothetical protein
LNVLQQRMSGLCESNLNGGSVKRAMGGQERWTHAGW